MQWPIDIVGNKYVTVIHGSVPEFLEAYFRRRQQWGDYHTTVAMTWGYLFEVKLTEAQRVR